MTTNVVAVLLACSLALVSYVVWRRSQDTGELRFTHPDGFSEAHYAPMVRILGSDDIAFLRAQRGCTPQIERAFRKRRRTVFRQFLTALRQDFRVLDGLAHEIVLTSDVDRSDLVRQLAKQRFLFHRRMMALECLLLLDRCGISLTPATSALQACAEFRGLVMQLRPQPLTAVGAWS